MKKRILLNLQLFAEDPLPANSPSNPPEPANNPPVAPEIDYDKLASIVQGKQSATEDSVLRGYFKQQGLSKEDADRAIADFKEKQKANDPSNKVKELENELNQYRQNELLAKKHVNAGDYDYVAFKAGKLVKEKNLTFEKAVDAFLKDNPHFASGQKPGYRVVDTGTPAGGTGMSKDSNDVINAAIRRAAGKEI